jgi:hypothetical protein
MKGRGPTDSCRVQPAGLGFTIPEVREGTKLVRAEVRELLVQKVRLLRSRRF